MIKHETKSPPHCKKLSVTKSNGMTVTLDLFLWAFVGQYLGLYIQRWGNAVTYLGPDCLSTQITGLTMCGQSPSLSQYFHTQRRKLHTIQTFSSIFYIITSCAMPKRAKTLNIWKVRHSQNILKDITNHKILKFLLILFEVVKN